MNFLEVVQTTICLCFPVLTRNISVLYFKKRIQARAIFLPRYNVWVTQCTLKWYFASLSLLLIPKELTRYQPITTDPSVTVNHYRHRGLEVSLERSGVLLAASCATCFSFSSIQLETLGGACHQDKNPSSCSDSIGMQCCRANGSLSTQQKTTQRTSQ